MKRHIAIISCLMLIVFMLFSLSACSKVEVTKGEIVAVFKYGDSDIEKQLSEKDAQTVIDIFDGKSMFSDAPSCSFTEDVALIINENTYCIACDTCGKIYNVKENKYFNLSDKENEILRNLLNEYGFTFPCV